MEFELSTAAFVARLEELALALAIGALMGLERGWRERDLDPGDRVAGVRTFALIGLTGGIAGVFAQKFGGLPLAAGVVAVAGVIGAFQWLHVTRNEEVDATPVIAAIAAFSLGAYAVVGDARAAAAAGVAATLLLAMKEALHAWVRRLTWKELRGALLLLVMTVIVLPALPDADIGPWDALNPRALWLLTILIAAVSFAGYIAMKAAGPGAGPMLAGAAGGLASSTAATVGLSRLAKEQPGAVDGLCAGAVLANAVMLVRVGAFVTVLRPEIAGPVLSAAAPAAAATAIVSWALWRRGEAAADKAELSVENPFSFSVILQFGVLLAAISLAAGALEALVGSHGVVALAAVSGIADVDALTVSMTRPGTAAGVAALAVVVAAGVNTATKTAIGAAAGGAPVARRLAIMAVAALGAGGAGAAAWYVLV